FPYTTLFRSGRGCSCQAHDRYSVHLSVILLLTHSIAFSLIDQGSPEEVVMICRYGFQIIVIKFLKECFYFGNIYHLVGISQNDGCCNIVLIDNVRYLGGGK